MYTLKLTADELDIIIEAIDIYIWDKEGYPPIQDAAPEAALRDRLKAYKVVNDGLKEMLSAITRESPEHE